MFKRWDLMISFTDIFYVGFKATVYGPVLRLKYKSKY
jgi:hypothetical protein